MCEILLRVVDKVPLHTVREVRHISRAGHVITAQRDGWKWSADERANPAWRIVSLPGASLDSVHHWLTATEECGRRSIHLDLAQLAGEDRTALMAPRYGDGIVTLSKASLEAVEVRQPKLGTQVLG